MGGVKYRRDKYTEIIFYLSSIYILELMMLNEDLLRDFETRIQNWESQKKIADVIVKKGPYLKLYTVYIRDFSSMNLHFDECCQKHPKFGKVVKVWA